MELCIIIPAYNSIDTIGTTLNSIKEQDLEISFEVIIVNDCSKYRYKKFVDMYSMYFNIREIFLEKNSGPGIARQEGIDNSNSKYIVFIDSDDYFYDNDSLIDMYNTIEEKQADLLISNFIYERDNIERLKINDLIWLHGKIFKRSFIEKYNIRFNSTRANEDNGFNRLVLLLQPKIVFLDKITYIYKENLNSITRKNNRLYKFTGIEGFCYNMNWAMDEAIKRNVNKHSIGYLSLDCLITLYLYYLMLHKEYNVDRILVWAKNIKHKYNKYKKYVKKDEVDRRILKKDEDLKNYNNNINYFISFEDFFNSIK